MGDQRVKMELVEGFDPLPVSSIDEKSFGFQIIKKTVLDMFPTVTVAPGRIQTVAKNVVMNVRYTTSVLIYCLNMQESVSGTQMVDTSKT